MACLYDMQYGTHQLTINSLRPRVPGGPQGDERKDKNSLTLHTTTDVYAPVNVERRTSIGIYLLVLLLPPDTLDVQTALTKAMRATSRNATDNSNVPAIQFTVNSGGLDLRCSRSWDESCWLGVQLHGRDRANTFGPQPTSLRA